MEPQAQSRTHTVTAGAQAAALEHILRPWLLLACAQKERSLGDLSRELGLPIAKAHYHVSRLLDCGLLRIAGTQARAGRPIKLYRAIAEVFVVSLADISEHVSEGLTRELRRSLAQEVNRRDSYLRFRLDETGRAIVNLVNPQGGRLTERALDHWKVMRLTADQRVALAAELTAVIARHEEASTDSGELFLVHAAFAPKEAL